MNNMKKSLKASNGITLIALVITIIVLLILAGISISMLDGDNGILTKTTDSRKMTEIADAKEQAQLDILAWQTEKISKGENSDLNDTVIKEEILKNKSYVKQTNESSFITANGEHEILYSDLYTKITPASPRAGESGYAGGSYNDPYIPLNFTHTGDEDWNHGS